jgi:uncharacterized protein YqhQ
MSNLKVSTKRTEQLAIKRMELLEIATSREISMLLIFIFRVFPIIVANYLMITYILDFVKGIIQVYIFLLKVEGYSAVG